MTSHDLVWDHGEATVLSTAAMLAECRFDLPAGPFRPFAKAPWMGTIDDPAIIGHLRELGGDFVCVPMGAGGHTGPMPADWQDLPNSPAALPIHGPAGDAEWTITNAGPAAITLALDYAEPSPVRRLERTIAVRRDAPALDLTLTIHARRQSAISVGLHPILRLPETLGRLELAAEFGFGLVHPTQAVSARDQEFARLSAVVQAAGTLDLSHVPLPLANLNVQLCGMRGPLTATYLDEGCGVVLDWDRTLLPSLQIWHTDRGIAGKPWNNLYRGLGLEPIAAAFDLNDAVSTGPNPINRRGVPTAIAIHPALPTVIGYSVAAFSS
ncbi:hypothetical protein [uncultured Devosia sp.]|uniref:hypothetical protein n=1 Tax=uncultured Devosia sp. TaxID=211434 RepID=UPI0035CA9DE0